MLDNSRKIIYRKATDFQNNVFIYGIDACMYIPLSTASLLMCVYSNIGLELLEQSEKEKYTHDSQSASEHCRRKPPSTPIGGVR